MKLGRQVHVTLLIDEINGSRLLWETIAFAKYNMAVSGHPFWSYIGKFVADFRYIWFNYKVFDGS